MLMDYHIHTGFVRHASGSITELCKAAADKGIREICFTEHMEFDPASDSTSDPGMWESYFREIPEASAKAGIRAKIGVEIGYDRRYIAQIREFLNRYDFDYVLGSVHVLDNEMLSASKKASPGTDIIGSHKRYYMLVAEMAESLDIDCIGHLDVVKKQYGAVPAELCSNELNRLFLLMDRMEIGFELNTSGWMKAAMCYPDPEILRLLHDKGIRKVTVGSDCHNPAEIGCMIEEGIAALREAGFKEICSFSKRMPTYLRIG
jgi:histidinol-phosphatase (PHP family)